MSRKRWSVLEGAMVWWMSGCVVTSAEPVVRPPPHHVVQGFALDPFYQKCLLSDGFPILGSQRVNDAALFEAVYLTEQMLSQRPEIKQGLIQNKVRFSIMAIDEMTTDVPEHSDLRPAGYWDRRARGIGATAARPSVSCGEENLLHLNGDPYGTENIFIHEFSHAIHEMGLSVVDPTFDARLERAYTAAMKAGLWKGTYASTNRMEYWAEGAQSWFDTNRENDSEHNHVNTRAEIKQYDPTLSALLGEVFGDGDWRYTLPEQRTEMAHLRGFDRRAAPRFQWSARAQQWSTERLFDPRTPPDGLTALSFHHLPPDQAAPASVHVGPESVVMIVNASSEELWLDWIDPSGQRRGYGSLRPGTVQLQLSYQGHVFLLRNQTDTFRGYMTVEGREGRVIVK